MNKYFYLSVALPLSLFLSACVPTANTYYPVKNHSPRVSTLGFHISPPPGGNWYEKHIDDTLFYLKDTTTGTYAITTSATELVFQKPLTWHNDLLEYVKLQKNLHQNNPERYQNSSNDYSVERILSSMCVRYSNQYNDYGDKGKGVYEYVKVVNRGLICIHPDSARIGIDISFMEKSIPGADNQSFRSEGERFISSLNFLKPTQFK